MNAPLPAGKQNGSGHGGPQQQQQQQQKKISPANSSSSSRLPVPIAVELHNLFPNIRIPAKKWFRPEHSTALLHAVRMEITVQKGQEHKKASLLHTEIDRRRTQCPVWQHLNDSISYKDLTVTEYESMRARFSLLASDDSDSDAAADAAGIVPPHFLETNLHPSKLCRIAKLPPNLPLNCTVVRFSDNSMRVHPAHYQLLLDSRQGGGMATTNATNATAGYGSIIKNGLSRDEVCQNDKNRLFFDDNVFHALDDPPLLLPGSDKSSSAGKSFVSPPTREMVMEAMNVFKEIPSSLLLEQQQHDDDDDDTNGSANAVTNTKSKGVTVTPPSEAHAETIVEDNGAVCALTSALSVFDFDRVDDDNDDDALLKNGDSLSRDAQTKVDGGDDDFDLQQVALESEALKRLIEQEEQNLERERDELQREKELLRTLVDEIRMKDAQTAEIVTAVQAERAKIYKGGFILEAQRIRLIRELSAIYPITVEGSDKSRYLIRGLEIPLELFPGSSVPEDVVSAALGFLCHLVHLMSKYLGVHLRYRLHCQSSRSAIQDERAATYPLFQGRPMEREQLEYGIHLLDKNIECICRARGIRLSPKLHILAKTMLIYENVIEGY